MGYYDWTDLPYYYELAYQFGTSDNFFSGLLSNTIPNRMYLFTATSFGHIRSDAPPSGSTWSQPTIFDKLTQAGISWRYYFQDNSIFLAQFSTWNRDSGKVLWAQELPTGSEGIPATYEVGGRQYLAVPVGAGAGLFAPTLDVAGAASPSAAAGAAAAGAAAASANAATEARAQRAYMVFALPQ